MMRMWFFRSIKIFVFLCIVTLVPLVVYGSTRLCEIKGKIINKTFETLDSPTIEEVNLRVIDAFNHQSLENTFEDNYCFNTFTSGQVIRVVYPKIGLNLKGGNLVKTVIGLDAANPYGYIVHTKEGNPVIAVLDDYGNVEQSLLGGLQDFLNGLWAVITERYNFMVSSIDRLVSK